MFNAHPVIFQYHSRITTIMSSHVLEIEVLYTTELVIFIFDHLVRNPIESNQFDKSKNELQFE